MTFSMSSGEKLHHFHSTRNGFGNHIPCFHFGKNPPSADTNSGDPTGEIRKTDGFRRHRDIFDVTSRI